ncbi:hypothetical protein [Dokdonia sp.]|uniref:hypothetical protein n=1 Tax=Dokdonia sp. TaxID=2024995 RepID=UPI003267180D
MFLKQISLLYLLLLIPFFGFSQTPKGATQLQAAYKAYGSLQLEESRNLFTAVTLEKTATKEEQCKALRELATQDWKFYKDYDIAMQKLSLADSIGNYRSETWLKVHRIEEEAGHYAKALEAAKKSTELAKSDADKRYAQYKYCHTVLEQAISQVNASTTYNTELLNEASSMLQEILAINPTNVNAAELLLGISLLQKDGNLALKGWLSYFRFSNYESVYEYLKEPSATLHSVLPKLSNSSLSEQESIALIKALGQSRFYTYAKILAIIFSNEGNTNFQNSQEIQDLIIYSNYMEEVASYTDEYYRKMTIDEGDTDSYLAHISSTSEALYKELLVSEKIKDTFNNQRFRALIRSKFGTVSIMGRTSSSNIMGLVMGQIVNERIRKVEQYGHSADFNFTELDMMVSNGYPSWFWEDRGAGGFAIRGGFLRVKKMFKYLGISAWEGITDPIKRAKAEREIKKNIFESTLTSDRNSILIWMASKLELDALDVLYAQLYNEGCRGVDLQLKFIEQYDLYRDNATMFAHEGRHSLDRVVLNEGYQSLGVATIEYRARLSQIVFSESPKLELANMVAGVGSTGSGLANKMIVDVVEKWIQVNTSKIEGYDQTKLAIAQIYLLTDDQIKTIYRDVDPFYKK